jgi:hypothetical protein
MRRLSLLAFSLLAACEPPTPEVNVDLLIEPPLEVDTHQDTCKDQSGVATGAEPFIAEEMCAQITVPVDDWYIEARQVSLDFDDYCVSYLIQNENGELEDYCNGMQLHLDPANTDGQPATATIPLRAVAFTQKQSADEQFSPHVGTSVDELQVKATLTLYSTNRWNNEQIETVVDYDILMTDFDNCEGIPPIACGQ